MCVFTSVSDAGNFNLFVLNRLLMVLNNGYRNFNEIVISKTIVRSYFTFNQLINSLFLDEQIVIGSFDSKVCSEHNISQPKPD
jgi:hypothetical protein